MRMRAELVVEIWRFNLVAVVRFRFCMRARPVFAAKWCTSIVWHIVCRKYEQNARVASCTRTARLRLIDTQALAYT